jgi:hypothetical protein
MVRGSPRYLHGKSATEQGSFLEHAGELRIIILRSRWGKEPMYNAYYKRGLTRNTRKHDQHSNFTPLVLPWLEEGTGL